MDFPDKIIINDEEFKNLGGRYYASRTGRMICVSFGENGEIINKEEIFKPSAKEG